MRPCIDCVGDMLFVGDPAMVARIAKMGRLHQDGLQYERHS
jgi:hypothetical protein